jgi:hypothetical protein
MKPFDQSTTQRRRDTKQRTSAAAVTQFPPQPGRTRHDQERKSLVLNP